MMGDAGPKGLPQDVDITHTGMNQHETISPLIDEPVNTFHFGCI